MKGPKPSRCGLFASMKLRYRIEAAAKRCNIDVRGFKRAALQKACAEIEGGGQITFPAPPKDKAAATKLDLAGFGLSDLEVRLFRALAERDGHDPDALVKQMVTEYTNSHLTP